MPIFPGAVADDSNLYSVSNFTTTTLDGAIDAVTTTVVLTSAVLFPTSGFIVLDASTGSREVISYTSKTGNSLNGVVRGADGTTAASHLDLAQVEVNIVAGHHNALKEEVKAIEQNIADRLSLDSSDVGMGRDPVPGFKLTVEGGEVLTSAGFDLGVSGEALGLTVSAGVSKIKAYSSGALSAGDLLIQESSGNVGIGTAPVAEKLEVSGAIVVGDAAGTADGTIRWTGSDFEGRKAGVWTSLTSGGGSSELDVTTVTGNTTITDTNDVILVDATSGNITITLHAVATAAKKRYDIKKIDATANTVTINPNAAELIDGAATVVLTVQYESRTQVPNGSFWSIV